MGAVRLIVIIAVGLSLWVLWRRHRFPGGWTFAFSSLYEKEREALAHARRTARQVSRTAAEAESAALAGLTSAQTDYERTLRQLEQRIARLRSPGAGERIGGLGELTLFQHILVVTAGASARSMELAGLDARFDTGKTHHSIYLVEATGRVYRATYRHLVPATDDLPQFDEEAVRDFAVAIQNAVADENSFRARIAYALQQAQQELEEARADTRAQEAARHRLAQVRQRNQQDPHRKAAESELEGALEDWKNLTGCKPPK
ncbi:hypothetical protein [Streptomyces althioticus]|uniref:hypothetical protein n=1 Tax=Streptomyces althioticus TaxID=83380 RepID=UPI0036FFE66D